jgi:CDP-glucose 4,6-dehydratase
VRHEIGDLRDAAAVKNSIRATQPDFVLHLAAQALVRTSYEEPVQTYATNVMGTIHVMEALRELEKPCVAVLVTTDKCYENREWVHDYREDDPLGGWDPYSSSKAATEIAAASWRRSFFQNHQVKVATARAGNVIGGGDWAKDRILADCIRALEKSEPIPVRNKTSTRPWQFVLEPLSGYLWLAAVLAQPSLRSFDPALFTSAFNFGPGLDSNRTVAELVCEVLKHWPGSWVDRSEPNAVHEAQRLNLSIDKAYHLLGWKPVWDFGKAVAVTVEWYQKARSATPHEMTEETSRIIAAYTSDAAVELAPWP